MNDLPEWNEERAKLIFEAIPEANWTACDADGFVYLYGSKPKRGKKRFVNCSEGSVVLLGKFHCPDWTKSLYERKWRPKNGEKIFVVVFTLEAGFCWSLWGGFIYQERLLDRNLVFRTEAEAKARFEELMSK